MDSKINAILNVLGDAINKHGYLSGCSTQVPPISYWPARGKINVLVSDNTSKEDIETKADSIISECGFKSWAYIDNHGDCPDEIIFYE